MCGRTSLYAELGVLEERFDAKADFEYEPRYNIAPRQDLAVIRNTTPETITQQNWGLLPRWADDPEDAPRPINARAETVAEKPSFRAAYERQRCLVPADGFYEWAEVEGGSGKQPYRVTVDDGDLFAMAGLWERWTPPQAQTGLSDFGGGASDGGGDDDDGDDGGGDDGPVAEPEAIETFTVVTTEPNEVVAELHDRMAVVLAPDEEETWLSGDPDEVVELLDPYPADAMDAYPVSTAVNDPSNDSPGVIREAEI